MRTIPQRELRNQSGEILRETEKGESFLITVDDLTDPWVRQV